MSLSCFTYFVSFFFLIGVTDEDRIIDVDMVLKYQKHIQSEELINALINYDSDEDSIEDFQSYSERLSK